MAADIYAFGCLAFETFSGATLFEQEGETALVSAHIAHDGWPWPLQAWRNVPVLSALGALLSSALRHDPRTRASVPALRKGLSSLAPSLSRFSWPLAV
jgi:serine/threonine protein kinase